MSRKSPFVTYTSDEILAAEALSYIIIAGNDAYKANGRYSFDKKTAVKHYNKILNELIFQIRHGTEKQKKTANQIIRLLRIEPLRVN